MRRVCCVCHVVYGIKEPFDDDTETHGYCEACFKVLLTEIRQWRNKNEQNKQVKMVKKGNDEVV